MGHLQNVIDKPAFCGNIKILSLSVNGFAEWLDGITEVKNVNFPSIEFSGTLNVSRIEYLKICGTISKHGFTRLGNIVNKFRKILCKNSIYIDDGQGYIVIPDSQEWFYDNILKYHHTKIVWFLNEIRWGIYTYLQAEYRRAFTTTNSIGGHASYRYDFPPQVAHPLTQSMYWDLMNKVRSKPYFPRFHVSKYLQ